MIVYSRFPNDENHILMWAQHDIYMQTVGMLFGAAYNRYLQAVRLLQVETDLFKRLRGRHGIDHRVLQDAHDHIAAYYRLHGCPVEQMPLFQNKNPDLEKITRQWQDFYRAQSYKLAEDDMVVIEILTAVAYANTREGVQAEERLLTILEDWYPLQLERT